MLEIIFYIIALAIASISLLISFLIGLSALAIFFVGVPFVPTPQRNVKLVIDQFNLKPGQKFYDLGCGDARFLIEAERRGARAIGFEVSPWAYLRGRLNLLLNKSQARMLYKNFYQADLSEADAIFCFLLDTVMPKVEKKLSRELKPTSLFISYGFKLPNWPPKNIIEINPTNKRSSKIYIYQKF
jgi:SAM-dependent methyltransferase